PTLCEMAGLTIPQELQGSSVVPLLSDPEQPWKTAAFSQFLQGRFGRMHPDHQGRQYMGYALRTERYRYIEWYDWDPETDARRSITGRELYDLDKDRLEQVNIAALPENEELVEELSVRLDAGWRNARPPLPIQTGK
ncbi:MAG: DUF4976 domain-containing protein, partial [bacterium]